MTRKEFYESAETIKDQVPGVVTQDEKKEKSNYLDLEELFYRAIGK